ncbi:DUF6279 family lipoprotein [Bacteriovoracaceae bacterium]|nr:DUF6279 family lipoprotein [Bacteriovoracaceae bacterium]
MKIILLVLSFLFISSCSKISLGYKFGDWIISSKVRKFIRFQGQDLKRFDKVVDEHIAWHKEKVLPEVLKLNNSIISDIDKMDDKKVKDYFERIRNIYHKSVLTVIPKISPLLARINGIQLDRLTKKLYAGNERIEDQIKVRRDELIKEKKDQYLLNLKEWFGSVNEKQRKTLDSTFNKLFINPKARLARRSVRIRNFLNCYDEENIGKRTSDIESVLIKNWSLSDRYSDWRKEFLSFMVKFLKDLDANQKQFFTDTLNNYQKEIKSIVSTLDN